MSPLTARTGRTTGTDRDANHDTTANTLRAVSAETSRIRLKTYRPEPATIIQFRFIQPSARYRHSEIGDSENAAAKTGRSAGRSARPTSSSPLTSKTLRPYQIVGHALIELPSGLSPADWHLTPPRNGLPPRPAQKGFLLVMGRAQPYKGFDDLHDALALLRHQELAVPHLVLAAVNDNPEPCTYQRHLAETITDRGLSATPLTRFHPDIRRLLAHPALCGVVVPSRAEPFGRVPIKAYAAGATPVIATTAGGLAAQIIKGRTGLTATPEDPTSLAAALALLLRSAPRHLARRG